MHRRLYMLIKIEMDLRLEIMNNDTSNVYKNYLTYAPKHINIKYVEENANHFTIDFYGV